MESNHKYFAKDPGSQAQKRHSSFQEQTAGNCQSKMVAQTAMESFGLLSETTTKQEKKRNVTSFQVLFDGPVRDVEVQFRIDVTEVVQTCLA